MEKELLIACDFETQNHTRPEIVAFACNYFMEQEGTHKIEINNYKKLNNIIYRDFGGRNMLNSFFKYLLNIREYFKVNIFFHNFKNFDSYFLLPFLLDNFKQVLQEEELENNTFKLLYLNSFLVNIKLRYNDIVFNFLDSLTFFPGLSIAKIGKIIGIEKLETNYNINLKNKLSLEYLNYVKYTKRDVIILSEFLYSFINETKINFLNSVSIAGIAFKYYIQHFYNKGVFIQKEYYWHILNKSYYGGYTYLNKKYGVQILNNVNYYDINSAYPYVLSQKVPHGELEIWKNQKGLIARLFHIKIKKLKVNEYNIGIIRQKKKNEFYLESESEFDYYIWEFEFEYIKYFYKVFEYEIVDIYFVRLKNVFDKYVKYWYQKKEENAKNENEKEKMLYVFSKLMLNSLYGKFGENIIKDQRIYLNQGDIEDNEVLEYKIKNKIKSYTVIRQHKNKTYKNFFEYTIQQNMTNFSKFKNIAIASYVTAKARTLLYQNIIKNFDNFIYCDTDSIFLHNKKLPEYLISTKLGNWKIEKENVIAFFVKAKQYFIKDNNNLNFKLAGYSKNISEFDLEDLIEKGIVFQKLSSKKSSYGVILEEKRSKLIKNQWKKE